MLFAVVLLKAKWDPSGLQRPRLSLAFGGRSTLIVCAFGNLPQGERRIEYRIVQSVGFRVDAHACQPEHGLG